MPEVGVGQRRQLGAPLADQRGAVAVVGKPPVLHRLPVQLGPRVGGRDRDLQGVRVDLAGKPDRLLNRFPGLAGQPQDERPVHGDAEIPAVGGEPAGPVDPQPLLDIDQDLLVPGLIPDQQQPQPVIP